MLTAKELRNAVKLRQGVERPRGWTRYVVHLDDFTFYSGMKVYHSKDAGGDIVVARTARPLGAMNPGFVYAPYIPRLRLTSAPIVARTRKLTARWTADIKQDLYAFHSLEAGDYLEEMLTPTCMRQIKVNKTKLIKILKDNREEHRGLFLEAQKAFRQVAINALDEQLKAARDGKPFQLQVLVSLQAPQDHTKDYDRCIAMLEMSVEKEVIVSDQEFQNFVQDTWSWSRNWALSNQSYVSSGSKYYGKLSAMAGSEEE